MRFSELISEVQDLLNFNPSAADQDFTEAQVKKALNIRYGLECNMGQMHGRRTWFHRVQSITWTSGEETLLLPSSVSQAGIMKLEDITDRDPGYPLPETVFWKDSKTLQWGDTAPGSDRTIRVTYFARPVDLVAAGDEPELIPPEHHMLLVWSAAIYLRQKADESVPQTWLEQHYEERLNFWKAMSRSRPMSGLGGPGSMYDITVSGDQVTQDGSSINQDNN